MGGQSGAWTSLHCAVFSQSGGNYSTQIGSNDATVTVDPDQEVFVVIQADFTTQSKDQDIEASWRLDGGDWAVCPTAATSTAWGFWNSSYATLDDTGVDHFVSPSKYIEDINSDGADPQNDVEFWFVLQAPTTEATYEIAISEDGEAEGGQGTITQICLITVGGAGGYANKVFGSDSIGKVFGVDTANIGKVFEI